MATKFSTQISYYTGDDASAYESGDDLTGSALQWFNDGIKDVISRIEKINPQKLNLFTGLKTVPSAGLALTNDKVFGVQRGNELCIEIDAKLRKKAVDTNSIYHVTAKEPIYYILGSKLYVIPDPATVTETSYQVIKLEPFDVDGIFMTQYTTIESHDFTEGDYVIFVDSDGDDEFIATADGYTPNTNAVRIHSTSMTTFVMNIPWNDDDYNTFLGDGPGENSLPDAAGFSWSTTVGDQEMDLSSGYNIFVKKEAATADVVTFGTATNSTGEIEDFPSSMYRLPVLYAAANILYSKLNAASITNSAAVIAAEFDTDLLPETNTVDAALTKAADYISDWNGEGNTAETDLFDFEQMVEDEDTELASLALQGAQAQLGIASAELARHSTEMSTENQAKVAKLQHEISVVQTELSTVQAQYQWTSQQLQYVKSLYNEGFVEVAQS